MSAAASAADPVTLVVVGAAGLGVLTTALRWRMSRSRARRRELERSLADGDSRLRKEGARLASELGLDRSAAMLLRLARREQDRDVLATIVAAVAVRQWEPASGRDVTELREWAAEYAAAHPEVRAAMAIGPDADALPPTRVLITGAGGPAGVAVIRELSRRGHYVIAVDADRLAVGLDLADEGHVIPPYADASYPVELARVAAAARAQALIGTVAEEYPRIDRTLLDEIGVRSLLPDSEAVRRCTDKWAFAETLAEAGLPAPATGLAGAAGVPGPWVVKPRFGRGSRDITHARTKTDLQRSLRSTPDPIVQTRVEGREFTVDVLVDGSGNVAGMVPRWRLETKAGISTKGRTFADPLVEETAALVLKAVGLVGPANVQGFVTDDGEVAIIEVNPRFSGGLPLSQRAGADLVGEYLRAILGLPVRPERLVARPGVTMMRYFEEVYAA